MTFNKYHIFPLEKIDTPLEEPFRLYGYIFSEGPSQTIKDKSNIYTTNNLVLLANGIVSDYCIKNDFNIKNSNFILFEDLWNSLDLSGPFKTFEIDEELYSIKRSLNSLEKLDLIDYLISNISIHNKAVRLHKIATDPIIKTPLNLTN